jgi:transcriptional regulator with XRE-family HTH domain
MAENKKYNRIRVILADRNRTIKWLAGQLNKKPNTVSRWCRNEMQPSIETFYKIAEILKVEIYDLFNPMDKVNENF